VTVLDLAGYTAAVLAGTGGCLLGVQAADWVNHQLGRDVPTPDEQEPS
jgi:hypothetical protein